MAGLKKWMNFVNNYVRDNCETMTDEELCEGVSKLTGKECTLHSLRKIRQRIGIKKKMGRPKKEGAKSLLLIKAKSCQDDSSSGDKNNVNPEQ